MKRKSDVKKFLVIIIPLAIVLLLILGSKYVAEKYFRKTPVTSEIVDEMAGVDIVSERDLQGELPENFPNTLPIYEGAVIDESWETKSEDAYAMSVVWRVIGEPSEIFHFYEEGLMLAGYDISVLSGDSSSYTITFSGVKEAGFVGIVEDGQETLISVTIGNSSN